MEPSPPELHHIKLEKTEPLLNVDKFDDEVMEDEHDYVEVEHLQHADHFKENALEVEQVRPLVVMYHTFESTNSLYYLEREIFIIVP